MAVMELFGAFCQHTDFIRHNRKSFALLTGA